MKIQSMPAELDNNLVLFGETVKPGEDRLLNMPVPNFYPHLPAQVPVRVIRSKTPGPRVFISGVIHGDEVVGIEIIAKLLACSHIQELRKGDLIIIPVVNIFGFINQSRYLPDRRDLNRSFPGNERGSMAARLAHVFTTEIVEKCTHGIDLHSGAANRFNLPQIRIAAEDEEAMELAKAFSPPLILKTDLLPNSLREFTNKRSIPTLLFEGSEAGRFDEKATEAGWKGIVNMLHALGMVEEKAETEGPATVIAGKSYWQRAHESGIFRPVAKVGDNVKEGDVLGALSEFFGNTIAEIVSEYSGVIIGQTLIPVVNEGDALFHIAVPD